jgi:hypothetical protein
MLVPDRLTAKMTVRIHEAEASPVQSKSVKGLLMIEWEQLSGSIGVYRALSKSGPSALIRLANAYRDVCRHLSRSIGGMPFNLTARKSRRAAARNLPER